uniref:Uncharacterized protein n=1 Tax=Romanomermis culicivorax TaxID=13658 RepID=A0A915JFR3_ROMCU
HLYIYSSNIPQRFHTCQQLSKHQTKQKVNNLIGPQFTAAGTLLLARRRGFMTTKHLSCMLKMVAKESTLISVHFLVWWFSVCYYCTLC